MVQTVKSPKGLSCKICPREVPRVIRLSREAQPRGKVWLPEGPPAGKFFRQSLRTFHFWSDFGLQKPKTMWPRVGPWACLEKQLVLTCSSLTVFNPDLGDWRTKSTILYFSMKTKDCWLWGQIFLARLISGSVGWLCSLSAAVCGTMGWMTALKHSTGNGFITSNRTISWETFPHSET